MSGVRRHFPHGPNLPSHPITNGSAKALIEHNTGLNPNTGIKSLAASLADNRSK